MSRGIMQFPGIERTEENKPSYVTEKNVVEERDLRMNSQRWPQKDLNCIQKNKDLTYMKEKRKFKEGDATFVLSKAEKFMMPVKKIESLGTR